MVPYCSRCIIYSTLAWVIWPTANSPSNSDSKLLTNASVSLIFSLKRTKIIQKKYKKQICCIATRCDWPGDYFAFLPRSGVEEVRAGMFATRLVRELLTSRGASVLGRDCALLCQVRKQCGRAASAHIISSVRNWQPVASEMQA